jgi:hypothetical protein
LNHSNPRPFSRTFPTTCEDSSIRYGQARHKLKPEVELIRFTNGENKMSFISILKKVGMIGIEAAPAILGAVNEPLGGLVGTAVNAVIMAEAKIGAGNGTLKKEDAMNALQVAIPVVVKFFESATGKTLTDQTQLASGLSTLTDSVVAILNAFGILPKPVPAVAVQPPAAQ